MFDLSIIIYDKAEKNVIYSKRISDFGIVSRRVVYFSLFIYR